MKTRHTLFAALAALILSATSVMADHYHFSPFVQQGTAPAVAPYVNPYVQPAPLFQPRLEFNGHFCPGRGIVVNHVIWGGLAHRIGLERGDAIVAINGQTIYSDPHYFQLLQEAALYNGGHLTLLVRNVRGCPAFVTLHVQLPGSGPIHYMHSHP